MMAKCFANTFLVSGIVLISLSSFAAGKADVLDPLDLSDFTQETPTVQPTAYQELSKLLSEIPSEVKQAIAPVQFLPDQTANSYQFAGLSFQCDQFFGFETDRSLSAQRCRPYEPTLDQQALGFKNLLLRSVVLSPSIAASVSTVDSNRWLVRQSFSSWYPSLSLTSGSVMSVNISNTQNYTSSDSGGSNPSASGTSFQPTTEIGGNRRRAIQADSSEESSGLVPPYTQTSSYLQAYPVLTLNWQLFDLSRSSSISASKEQLTASQFQALDQSRQTILSVATLYSQLQASEYQIATLLSLCIASQQLLDRYQNQLDQGFISKAVLLSQRSNLESSKAQLLSAVATYQSTLEQIKASAMIFDSSINLVFPQTLALPQSWPVSLDQTKQLVAQYPSVLAYQHQAQQYAQLSQSSLNGYWPVISVLGYITYEGTQGSQNYSPPQQPSGAWSSQISNYIGLNFTWNIFDGFSSYQQARSYASQSLSYTQQGLAERQSLLSEAMSSIEEIKLTLPLLQSLDSSYQAEAEAYDSYMLRMQAGIDDYSVIFQSQQQLSSLLSSYSSSYQDLFSSYFQLIALTGMHLNAAFFD